MRARNLCLSDGIIELAARKHFVYGSRESRLSLDANSAIPAEASITCAVLVVLSTTTCVRSSSAIFLKTCAVSVISWLSTLSSEIRQRLSGLSHNFRSSHARSQSCAECQVSITFCFVCCFVLPVRVTATCTQNA